jgi:hypothetical protein
LSVWDVSMHDFELTSPMNSHVNTVSSDSLRHIRRVSDTSSYSRLRIKNGNDNLNGSKSKQLSSQQPGQFRSSLLDLSQAAAVGVLTGLYVVSS